MTNNSISKSLQDTLNDINQKFEQAYAEGAHLSAEKGVADGFWKYLQKCEEYYLSGNIYKEAYTHDMENILSLYHLNLLIDQGHLTSLLREAFSIPKSKVTEEKLATDINLAGWVAGDGTIYAVSKYCQLDLGWTIVLVNYYYFKLFPKKKHPFVPAAMKVLNTEIPSKAKIAIIGDWGTGAWKDGKKDNCPAQLVIDGIVDLDPDYIIHLGDVYYAGSPKEERQNFLEMLPKKYKGRLYTMNSNHEMYYGANGLMGTTLKDPRFAEQGGSTYFSIEIGDWILVGLDSAYYDDSFLYMKGSLTNAEGGEEQLSYLREAHNTGKNVMLMTHHNGIEVDKTGPARNTDLWGQVYKAMKGNLPKAWYWGHVHNGIVYQDQLPIYGKDKAGNDISSMMRCCGHASIPFGNAPYLEGISQGSNPDVKYYAHTPMPSPTDEVQKLRVINGFAVVEIDGSSFTETFYEVSNIDHEPKQVWPK